MYRFSVLSLERLNSCHEDLRLICHEAIKYIDFSVLEGHRSLEKQQEYFKSGKSKLDGINKKSKHQYMPSRAVDIAPYPIDFKQEAKSKARFYFLAGIMFAVSNMLFEKGLIAHKLRWGGDWNGNIEFHDQTFDDLPHFELMEVSDV